MGFIGLLSFLPVQSLGLLLQQQQLHQPLQSMCPSSGEVELKAQRRLLQKLISGAVEAVGQPLQILTSGAVEAVAVPGRPLQIQTGGVVVVAGAVVVVDLMIGIRPVIGGVEVQSPLGHHLGLVVADNPRVYMNILRWPFLSWLYLLNERENAPGKTLEE
jgi:hypothetical protein